MHDLEIERAHFRTKPLPNESRICNIVSRSMCLYKMKNICYFTIKLKVHIDVRCLLKSHKSFYSVSGLAVFILQTNYPSRRIMRPTFYATDIKTGRIMGRTKRQRMAEMSLSGREI